VPQRRAFRGAFFVLVPFSATTPLREPPQARLGQPRGAGAGSAGWGALAHTPGEDAPGGAGRDGAVFGVLPMSLL
jgi:hypothetical protein